MISEQGCGKGKRRRGRGCGADSRFLDWKRRYIETGRDCGKATRGCCSFNVRGKVSCDRREWSKQNKQGASGGYQEDIFNA